MQEDGVWRTINGAKVFIKNGQSVMDAFVRQKAYKQKEEKPSQEKIKEDIIDVVNNGQVFEFTPGPQMTLCSRYEDGKYNYLMASGDSPMWRFEAEIVPYLQEQFVVVDDGVSYKTPRTSRFKKYGYEVVGNIKERKQDHNEGKYTDEEETGSWVKTWYLMRKKGASK